MARYFFHIVDDSRRISDDEGMELSGLMAVAQEAEASAKDALRHGFKTHRPMDDRRIEVTDERGTIILVQLLRALTR